MKARRILIAALWLNLVGVTATAETIVIRPDYCAAPANAPRLVSLGEPDAPPGRSAIEADDIIVLYAVPDDGWASARILARFSMEDGRPRSAGAPRCRRQ